MINYMIDEFLDKFDTLMYKEQKKIINGILLFIVFLLIISLILGWILGSYYQQQRIITILNETAYNNITNNTFRIDYDFYKIYPVIDFKNLNISNKYQIFPYENLKIDLDKINTYE